MNYLNKENFLYLSRNKELLRDNEDVDILSNGIRNTKEYQKLQLRLSNQIKTTKEQSKMIKELKAQLLAKKEPSMLQKIKIYFKSILKP